MSRKFSGLCSRLVALPVGALVVIGALLTGAGVTTAVAVLSPSSESATPVVDDTISVDASAGTVAPPTDSNPGYPEPPFGSEPNGEWSQTDFTLVCPATSPSVVTAGSEVRITWRLTNPNGTSFTTAYLRTPSDKFLTNCGGGDTPLQSGSSTDGTYTQVCTIPRTVSNGRWSVWIHAEEHGGTVFGAERADYFEVTGGSGDEDTPVASSVSVSPSTVQAGDDYTITWRLSDASGVTFTTAFVRTSDRTWIDCGGGAATRVSGTATSGTYRQTCTMSRAAADGTYEIVIDAEDPNGNMLWYENAGTSTVTGGGGDTTAPVVVSASASPSSVSPGASVTFTWRLADGSGVTFTTAFLKNPAGTWVSGCGGGLVSRSSGSATDGTYSQTCTLSTGARGGTYSVVVQAIDAAGNQISNVVVATFVVVVPTTTTSTTTTTTTTTAPPG